MNSKQLVKAALIFGGGYLIFLLLKPKKKEEVSEKKSLDGEKTYPAPNSENAEIVMMAYSDALKNGEPSIRLTELNKEMMNEFGMRCYVDSKTNQLVVCDVKGETILTK